MTDPRFALGRPGRAAHDAWVRPRVYLLMALSGGFGTFAFLLLARLIGNPCTGCLGLALLATGWFFTFRTMETFMFVVIMAIFMGVCCQSLPLLGAIFPGAFFSLLYLPLLLLRLLPSGDIPDPDKHDKK